MTKGEVIKAAREAANLTQKNLGASLGLSPVTAQPQVARWELGIRPVPLKLIKPLAELLNLDPADLLPG